MCGHRLFRLTLRGRHRLRPIKACSFRSSGFNKRRLVEGNNKRPTTVYSVIASEKAICFHQMTVIKFTLRQLKFDIKWMRECSQVSLTLLSSSHLCNILTLINVINASGFHLLFYLRQHKRFLLCKIRLYTFYTHFCKGFRKLIISICHLLC